MADAPDPRDATFWANQAALDFARQNTLGEDIKGREGTEAKYKYERGELERAEPLRLKANTNRANTEGLLESGILAQRQGQTQSEYVGKEGRLAEQRKEAIQRYNEGDTKAQREYDLGYNEALAKAQDRYQKNLIEYPPQPEAAAPTYPANPAQAGGKPGPGGVVPYETPNVRVGPGRAPAAVPRVREQRAQPVTGARRAAVRKLRVG